MKKEGNYVFGIIGAILGGIIATIPWILMYIYGNMMFSALAIIIAWCALKGYRLFKGKDTKYLPLIITIISVLSVSIATLIVIPLALLYKEGFPASLYNLQILYKSSEFVGSIIKDFVIAVLFTFLGISGIIKNLKMELNSENKSEETKLEENN